MVALTLLGLLLVQTDPLAQARKHAERGELAAAIDILESSSQTLPSASTYTFLSDLQARTNRLPQAARSLALALELAPEQHRWRATLGTLYFQLGRMEEARRELERVIRGWPEGALAHYYLANVLKTQGELELAEGHAQRAVELLPMSSIEWALDRLDHPPPVNALFLLGDIHDARGEDAEGLVRQVLEAEPLHAPALYLYARILRERGRPGEAADHLDQFRKVKRAEQHVMNALNLRYNYGAQEDARVLQELERAVEAFPEHPVALYLSGRELLDRGRRDEAGGFFERCAQLRPAAMAQEVSRLSARGAVLEAMEILEASSRAVSSAPAYAYLSRLQAQTNRLPQAARSLSRALDIDPKQHRWRSTRGALLFQLGRMEEARVELERAVRDWPEAALAHYYLGTVLKTQGDLERAEEHARRATELLPLSTARWILDRLDYPPPVNALFLLADVISARGGNAEALVRQVLQVEPVHAPARYLYAHLLEEQGQSEKSKEELAQFLEIKRVETRVRNALNYLYNYDTRETEKPLLELHKAVESYPEHPVALYLLGRELVRNSRLREAEGYLERCAELRPGAREQVKPLLLQLRN